MLKYIKNNYWILIILLFILAELVINPIGEFPLNDDWAYSKAIHTFLNTGQFKLLDWQTIPGLTLQFAGVLMCQVFGFSFTVLRMISIVSLMVLIITFFQILKLVNISARVCFFILLLLTFNPLVFLLSNTFMPDVFMLTMTCLAFLFMMYVLQGFKMHQFALFVLFSMAATLVRQTGLILPFVFAIIYVILHPRTRSNILIAILPIVFNISILYIYVSILEQTDKLPTAFNYQLGNIVTSLTHPSLQLLKSFAYYLVTSTVALGLFLLPLTISNFKHHFIQFKRSWMLKIVVLIYLSLVFLNMILSAHPMPFVGNIIYPLGLGPIIFTGFNSNEISHLSYFWKTLHLLGGISFSCILISVLNKLLHNKIHKQHPILYITILFIILYLIPICLSYANDRYLLFVIPFLILIYVRSTDVHIKLSLFLLSFLPILWFSVAGTHDYFNIHRMRWQAGNQLMNKGIPPTSIDGGFEFNAWYLYGSKHYNPDHKGRWWWIENDDYIISPSSVKGYSVESEYTCSNWLSSDLEHLFVLKKDYDNQ